MDVIRRLLYTALRRFPALRPGRLGWGAAQLSAASLASRLLGFLYSAALMRLAGPEAVGLFRVVWPLYATAYTVATAGLPYAMAKLLAEKTAHPASGWAGARPIASRGLALLAGTSAAAAGLLWWTSPWLVSRVGAEPRAAPVIQLMAPALPVACLAAGGRALFEGVRRMGLPAASVLAEQVALSAAVVAMVLFVVPAEAGPVAIACALAAATVAGEVVGLLVLAGPVQELWRSWAVPPGARRRGPGLAAPSPGTSPTAALLRLALPVAAGRVLSSVGASLSTLLLPNRLQQAGLSPSEAAAQVGLLRGVALPLVLMPNMLSMALTASLVPSVSAAVARGDRAAARSYSDKAMATTVLFALPAGAAFVAMPELWTRVLYGEEAAAPLLVACALAGPFIYLGQTLVGVLRGLGHPEIPVRSHLVGLALEAGLVWVWVGRPGLGIRGAALAAAAGYAAAYALNQHATLRRLGTTLTAADFAAPLAGAAACAAGARAAATTVLALLQPVDPGGTLSGAAALAAGLAVLTGVYGLALRASPVWRWLWA